MIKNKKGQIVLGDAPNLIRILVVLAVTLAVSALIISGFRTNQITFTTTQVANETNSSRALNTFTLAVNVQEGLTGTTLVQNATIGGAGSGAVVPSTNYTMTSSAGIGTLTWKGPSFNDTMVNVTYNYLADPNDAFSNITEDGLFGVQTFGSFQTLISLVIVAVIILGLVLFIGARQ